MAANLTLQPAAVLAGEGIGLFSVAEERVRAAIAADRDPRAEPVAALRRRVRLLRVGPGAATVAIQDAVDRIDLDPGGAGPAPRPGRTRGTPA